MIRHAFAAVVCLPAIIPAQQVNSSLLVGGLRVRYADEVSASAVMLAPAVTFQSRRVLLGLSGTISEPSVGPLSAQALFSGSVFRSLARPVTLELGGLASGSTTEDGTRTGHAQAVARAHLTGTRAGLWIGGSPGRTWDGRGWQSVGVAEAGAWTLFGRFGVSGTFGHTSAIDTINYDDLQISLRYRGPRLELDGQLGHRTGSSRAVAVEDPDNWGNASASFRIFARTAIVVSGGSYPLDLVQGFPAGRFLSVGLRISGPGSGPAPDFARATDDLTTERLLSSGVSDMSVSRLSPGRYRLRLRSVGSRTVELTGDMTGWQAVPMQPSPDGWWTITVTTRPGIDEIAVRRDGGKWVVPAGLPERRDEFGGVVGLLTVP